MSTQAVPTAGSRGRQATRNKKAPRVAAPHRFRAAPLRLEAWRAWFNQQLSASSKNSEQARFWPPEMPGSDVFVCCVDQDVGLWIYPAGSLSLFRGCS